MTLTLEQYQAEFAKRPLPSVNKAPLALASAGVGARKQIVEQYGYIPKDRVLVQNRMELSQFEFDMVVKALRLSCELYYDGNTELFYDIHDYAHTGVDENIGIEINVYDDGYPSQYGFTDDDEVVCVACYHHDGDTNRTDWDYTLASFAVHKDFFKPMIATQRHKALPRDMCQAIRQACETMEEYLSISEIRDMIACDQSTLTAEYRPQLTHDLEGIYESLNAYDKGVLQDRLDDMWIMYCITYYGQEELSCQNTK